MKYLTIYFSLLICVCCVFGCGKSDNKKLDKEPLLSKNVIENQNVQECKRDDEAFEEKFEEMQRQSKRKHSEMLELSDRIERGEVVRGNTNSSSGDQSNNSDSQLMRNLNNLNEEGRQLVDEIYIYYRTGQAGPGTIQAVFRLKQIQDEKISLARRMGDRELEAICRQQKAQTLAALRQIGF